MRGREQFRHQAHGILPRRGRLALEAFQGPAQVDFREGETSPRTGPPPTTSRRCRKGLVKKGTAPAPTCRPGHAGASA